ncbi:hypothetical protein [Kiloniella sp.]|uniref:hypothetical protein n=1 Tax=Kiloniella sp. TaxID=1938587 RepID=UPI003B01A74A
MNTFGIYRPGDYASAQEAADSGAMYALDHSMLQDPSQDINKTTSIVLATLIAAGRCVNHDETTLALALQREGSWYSWG